MGRLVLTRFNNATGKVEQTTLDNVTLTAEFVDDFGRRATIISLQANDQRIMQESYLITQITDQRLVDGIDYNVHKSILARREHEKKNK